MAANIKNIYVSTNNTSLIKNYLPSQLSGFWYKNLNNI